MNTESTDTIWNYDHAAGWSLVASPLNSESGSMPKMSEVMRHNGFLPSRLFGEEFGQSVTIYEHDNPETSIVSVHFADTGHLILVRDVLSLLALLGIVLPVLELALRLDEGAVKEGKATKALPRRRGRAG